jgi:uncharacterized membrane protein YkoI
MFGLIIVLMIVFTPAGRWALAGDGKGHGGNHDSSDDRTNNDHQDGNAKNDDSANSDESTFNAHEAGETAEKEQEEARQAVANGKAAPLTVLLKKLKTQFPGQVLDVTLLKNEARLRFVVKYIDKAGRVKTVTLDALTLEND